VKFSPLCICA